MQRERQTQTQYREQPDIDRIAGMADMPEPANVQAALNAAEVDVQVATAKRYPRSLAKAMMRMKEAAIIDKETAAECTYSVPKGGTHITGPSIRFAEIILGVWGNLRAESRILDIGDRQVTVGAVVWDLETNTAVTDQVQRRITRSNGTRYNDDMIQTTIMAARSIALRNAILRVIPQTAWKPAWKASQETAASDAKAIPLERLRAYLLKGLQVYGVTPERLCKSLGVPMVDELTHDHIADVKGRIQAIKDGELTVEQAFAPLDAPEPAKSSAAREAVTAAKRTLIPEGNDLVNGETGEVVEEGPTDPDAELLGNGGRGKVPIKRRREFVEMQRTLGLDPRKALDAMSLDNLGQMDPNEFDDAYLDLKRDLAAKGGK